MSSNTDSEQKQARTIIAIITGAIISVIGAATSALVVIFWENYATFETAFWFSFGILLVGAVVLLAAVFRK